MASIAEDPAREKQSPGASLIYDPKVRGVLYQVITVIVLAMLLLWIADNTLENLKRANIASGFGFLNGRAGFDIGQYLVAYTSDSTYGRALLIGFINTVVVAVGGILTATFVGFVVGVGRLSPNWIIAKLSLAYVEVFRNIPPLLVIFFWYSGVLALLPQPRNSMELPLGMFLNNRGLTFPSPVFGEGTSATLIAIAIGALAALLLAYYSRKRQNATGRRLPLWPVLITFIGLPALTFLFIGPTVTFDYPIGGRFSLTGGSTVGPEFLSLYLALSFYTASYVAEIVRAGIRGVSKGQTEAAHALGIRPGLTTRLVVVPQAMRIIIPPLTSQYLNLTKNSSLAIAVGYADLVAVGGTILNQTGQAIEVVSIWIIVYLTLSLTMSLLMNWFNARMALAER